MNAGPHPLLPRAFHRSRRGIGDYQADVAAQFSAQTGVSVDSSSGVALGTSIGTGAGAAVGSVVGPAGTVIGGAIGGFVGGAVAKLFGTNDPSPGDWTDWCAENAPAGGIPSGQEDNFTAWGWGPCTPDPNLEQGVTADANAGLVTPTGPTIVNAGAYVPHSGAGAYGSPSWIAAMTALSKLPGPNGVKGQQALAQYNAARMQAIAGAISGGTSVSQVASTVAARSPVAVSTPPSHPLMAMAKAPVGLSASASTGETLGIAVLALGAAGFVAWRKGWI